MISQSEYDNLLAFYPVLEDLPADLRAAFQSSGARLRRRTGQVLFEVGSACSANILISAGEIHVSRLASTGREILLYRVEPGETCILTTSCLLGDTRYPARGVVTADLLGYLMPGPLFLAAIAQAPSFRQFIFGAFTRRVANLLLLIEEIAFYRLDQRLAALLLSQGPVITTTHQMLADELGSVREVISRILRGFAHQRLVQLERGQIHVVNHTGLEEIIGRERDQSHRHPDGSGL